MALVFRLGSGSEFSNVVFLVTEVGELKYERQKKEGAEKSEAFERSKSSENAELSKKVSDSEFEKNRSEKQAADAVADEASKHVRGVFSLRGQRYLYK